MSATPIMMMPIPTPTRSYFWMGVAVMELGIIVSQSVVCNELQTRNAQLEAQVEMMREDKERDTQLFRDVFRSMALQGADPDIVRRTKGRSMEGADPTRHERRFS
jgi:hypothetical protein